MTKHDRPRKKYEIVREMLCERIRELPAGARLPSQEELMRTFDVSYSTVTRAIVELRHQGLIVSHQGRGMFVARREVSSPRRSAPVIGVVPHLSNWGFMDRVLAGFYDEAIQAGYTLAMPQRPAVDFRKTVSANRHAQVERERVGEMISRGVDAIAMTSFDTGSPETLGMIREAGIPVVFLEAIKDPSVDCVAIDDEAAGACASRHLLSQGYRRIAFTGAHDEIRTLYGSRRLAGYERVMAEAGLEGDFFEMPSLARGGATQRDLSQNQAMCDLLVERFDAVLTWSDHVAIILLTSLQLCGYRVPRDLAIVGFNDSPLCSEPSIDLTSLRQPVAKIGRVAFAILQGKIEGREPMQATPLPFELIVRGSSRRTNTATASENLSSTTPVIRS